MRSNRFGIPGVISVIALVFAMAGGAYAAKKYVITSTSQIKPSVLKSLQGKQGPKGDKGDNGSNGSAGSAGAKGDAGAPGAAGAAGAPGTGATTKTFTGTKGSCTEGGIEVASGSPTVNVCNGAEGGQGLPGQPWTPDNVLPPGAIETGTYELGSESGTGYFGAAKSTISFTIPLKAPIEGSKIIFVPQSTTPPADCKNASHAGEPSPENPEASPGFLCVYEVGLSPTGWDKTVEFTNPANSGLGAATTGTILNRELPAEGAAGASSTGTWAVTAAP